MNRKQETELELLIKAFMKKLFVDKSFKANVERVIKQTLPKK